MENILMLFCRKTHNHDLKAIAAHLGINVSQYRKIETGKILITETQARQLGKLFKVNGNYFYDAALQLELLLTGSEIIKSLKEKNKELEEQVKKKDHKGHSDTKRK